MILKSIRSFRYCLPLAAPVDIGGSPMMEREGFLIRCESESGEIGWGEAAPLPGYTRELLSDAETALRRIPGAMPGRVIEPEHILSGEVANVFPDASPSVLFGLETACLNLLSGPDRGFRRLLSPGCANQILVNGLLQVLSMPSAAELAQWAADGMQVVKCKVGRGNLEREKAWILGLADVLPPEMKIRVDANRAWSLREATAFFRGIPLRAIEYVEEPLREIGELPELAKRTNLPIALDETVQERGAEAFELGITPAAIVLKPGALSGISAVLKLGRMARDRSAQPVVSSLFESGVGILALAQLAAHLGADRVSCGLDTCRVLKEDTLVPRFSPAGGRWDLQEIDEMDFAVRENMLEELTCG